MTRPTSSPQASSDLPQQPLLAMPSLLPSFLPSFQCNNPSGLRLNPPCINSLGLREIGFPGASHVAVVKATTLGFDPSSFTQPPNPRILPAMSIAVPPFFNNVDFRSHFWLVRGPWLHSPETRSKQAPTTTVSSLMAPESRTLAWLGMSDFVLNNLNF